MAAIDRWMRVQMISVDGCAAEDAERRMRRR
jgi:hypothetical protein